MKETEIDHKWVADEANAKNDTGELDTNQLLLMQINLLARNYDLMLALLKHFDEEEAKYVYSEHNKGENFNPAMFLPDFKEIT